jgi:hypothetical protein
MLFSQNKKIKGSNTDQTLVINFGLPAYKSKTGLITCPSAGACAKGCYATQGAYIWSNVNAAYEKRLEATLTDQFIDLAQQELDLWLKRAKRQQKQLVVRVHDSGDYYNIGYINRWFRVMQNNPDIVFYSYTKQVKIFKALVDQGLKPNNLTLIYSYGGLFDHLIDPNIDRHSAVFSSMEELKENNYVDTTENDLNAVFSVNHRIGLVYHGAKSKALELKPSA